MNRVVKRDKDRKVQDAMETQRVIVSLSFMLGNIYLTFICSRQRALKTFVMT